MSRWFGWDIGGVHLKGAVLDDRRRSDRVDWRLASCEIWKGPRTLADRLRALHRELDRGGGRRAPSGRPSGNPPDDRHAVTMTAELSDVFATRDAGVRFVLAACRRAFGPRVLVLDNAGRLVPQRDAGRCPGRIAAANWMAPATVVARSIASAGLLVDVGSTTTDIVPLEGGRPKPRGRSDLRRLASRELVYTGVLRTPPAALADLVPVGDTWLRPAPEHFAVMADVWRLLGRIGEADYTVPTPDGRGRSAAACAARLARVVCAEPQELGRRGILHMARHLARRQTEVVADALRVVAARVPGAPIAVVAGSGSFLAAAAARRAGLRSIPIRSLVPFRGGDWGRAAPAACLAMMMRGETR